MRLLLTVPALLLLLGCVTTEDLMPPVVIATPLDPDPTDRIELAEWWTNGRQMIQLKEVGTYARFNSTNRYREPAEHGKWWQQSYAVLWLEPYRERREVRRVGITKINGKLALTVGKLEPMHPLEGPPPVPEDGLVGRWQGRFGTLRLGADRRYAFSPPAPLPDRPASLAGHTGIWRLIDGTVLLQPDAPNIQPIRLRTRRDADDLVLATAVGPLRRAQE